MLSVPRGGDAAVARRIRERLQRIACNPSMTIAAMAERSLDRIVRSGVGTVI